MNSHNQSRHDQLASLYRQRTGGRTVCKIPQETDPRYLSQYWRDPSSYRTGDEQRRR